MSEQYKVIGPCRVAGIAPGDTVSRQVLEEAGANIDALIGPHLEPVETKTSSKSKTAAAKDEA